MANAGEVGTGDWDSAEWRRSSACADSACLEVAFEGDLVAVRSSTAPEATVVVTRPEWAAFLAGVTRGEFSVP